MSSSSFEEDAKQLKQALFEEQDTSIKEKTVIDLIKKYDLKHRLILRITYDEIFPENNFLSDINTQLSFSGQFCNLVTALFMDPIDLNCLEFKKIFDKVSLKKNIIIESLTLNPFWYNQKLIRAYNELYHKDLKMEINKIFPENMRDALITCLNTKRNNVDKEIDIEEINEKVKLLIKAVDDLMTEIELPKSIKEYGVKEKEFMMNLDTLVERAFDDQCTGANPRYPLMSEIKQLFLDAYEGIV